MLLEKSEKPLELDDLKAVFLRRRVLFVRWALPAMLLTFLVALALPPTYRSTASILIEQQEIPQDLVRSTITSYADQRIQVITQRVMTSTNLLQIIDKFDLYAEERRQEPLEIIFEAMRKDIGTEMVSADVIDPRSGRPVEATIAFRVSYDNRNANTARNVASEITTLFLRENLRNRRQLAEQTESFLSMEAEKLGTRIETLGQEIARFKETHFQALPEHTELTLQQLERTERELAEIKQQSRNLKEQQNHLEAELSLADPYSPFIQSTGERVLSADARLKLLRSELASLQAQFTDAHPEVQRTRREIDALQNNQHDLQMGPPDNPAYLQLSTQLKNVQIERESLDLRRQDLQKKQSDYESRLATTPVIERRYRELLQEFESSSLKYREIKAKQQEAMLAFSLETEQKGERFTLLEPAVTPEKPVKPNRKAIFLVGMILSFGLAGGMVYLRENTDKSVHDKDELKDLLGTLPLSVVPYIETRQEQKAIRDKWRHTLYGAMVSVVVGVMLFHLLVKPLDVVWFAVIRKLGA